MLNKIIHSLKLPEAEKINDLDHFSTSELHAQIIQKKPFLKKIYLDFYRQFEKVIQANPQGVYIEVGSGGGFLKQVCPQVVTSDILQVRNVDLCFDVQKTPLKDSSVDGFFLIDVFHHINDPKSFLKELNRCLKPGGKIMMIEPANTAWGRFIYTHFHHEPFEPTADWKVEGDGPLSGANGALPWIVFKRDQEKFRSEFPTLEIHQLRNFMPFRYLLSGGLSLKQLFPSWGYGLICAIEWLLTPLNRFLGMFFQIVLQKK